MPTELRKDISVKDWSRATAKREIGAKLAGSCWTAAVNFIAYFTI